MPLKFKKKIYLSLDENILKFVDEQAALSNTTRTTYIRKLLMAEYEIQTNRAIDKIIEGK